MDNVFVDHLSWCRIWKVLNSGFPIIDTRSRGDLTVRIYDLKSRGQLLLALPMALLSQIKQHYQAHATEGDLQPPAFDLFIQGQQFELLPGKQLIWSEVYYSKLTALTHAVSWCEQLDVEPSYFESMRAMLNYLPENRPFNSER